MTTYKQIIYDGGDKVLVDMAKKAQKLNTARNINITDADGTHSGTAASFDGSGDVNIKLPATISADITGNAQTATSAGHQTTADSATSAGTAASATSAGTATSASEATKLSTARTIQTDLASGTAASFDGSANATPGVTGVLPIANGGTGNQNGIAQLLPTANGSVLRDSALSISNGDNNLTSLSITLDPGIYVYSYYDFIYTDPANSDTFMAVGFSYNNVPVWVQTTTAIPGDYTRNQFCYVLRLSTTSTVFPIIYRNGSGTEPQQQEMSYIRIA